VRFCGDNFWPDIRKIWRARPRPGGAVGLCRGRRWRHIGRAAEDRSNAHGLFGPSDPDHCTSSNGGVMDRAQAAARKGGHYAIENPGAGRRHGVRPPAHLRAGDLAARTADSLFDIGGAPQPRGRGRRSRNGSADRQRLRIRQAHWPAPAGPAGFQGASDQVP